MSAPWGTLAPVTTRPTVPTDWIQRLDDMLTVLPQCYQERAWTGTRWRVGNATVAHVFGGEDQRFRITFRAELDEVMAFEHLGEPYFTVGRAGNAVGIRLDTATDWDELTELLTDSYCQQAPAHLAEQVMRPSQPHVEG